jgi:MFS superfamily sulfate permease-like transporter
MKHSKSLFKNLAADLPSGLVVYLVALPLCLGIALASGAPLFSGIIAGIVGGIVVGFFSGSAVGVSGPAAGLAVIVLAAIESLGFETFLLAVIISGVFQLILGYARAGTIAYFFPVSVVKGMLTAIGLIIFLKQLPHLVGYDSDFEGDLAFQQNDGFNTFSELLHMTNYIAPGAIVISIISLVILLLWDKPFLSKTMIGRMLPGGLVVVILSVFINLAFTSFYPAWGLSGSHLVQLPNIWEIGDLSSMIAFPNFTAIKNSEVWTVAVVLTLVGSLETLLSVEAADKIDPHRRVTPTNRELKAQGIGNIVVGLIGGIPITQVVVRSSANVQAGGVSKMATIFHGFLLLLSVLLIPGLINMIPIASLAVILLLVGYKLTKPAVFKQMYRLGVFQFIPFIVTVVAIMFTDLLIGVSIGLVVSIFNILMSSYRTPLIIEHQEKSNDHYKLVLSQQVSFLNKGGIMQALNSIPANAKIIIDASNTISIDYDIVELIRDFSEGAKFKGINVECIGLEEKRPLNQFKRIKSYWELEK